MHAVTTDVAVMGLASAIFVGYLATKMSLKRHLQLLGLSALAVIGSIIMAGIIRQPGDSLIEALFNPVRWKAFIVFSTMIGTGGALLLRPFFKGSLPPDHQDT